MVKHEVVMGTYHLYYKVPLRNAAILAAQVQGLGTRIVAHTSGWLVRRADFYGAMASDI